MAKVWIIVAGLLGASAVGLGAYSAHGLEGKLRRPFESADGTITPLLRVHAQYRQQGDTDRDGDMDEPEILAYVAKQMHNADVAVKYQMYHALAIFAIGILWSASEVLILISFGLERQGSANISREAPQWCALLLNVAAALMLLGVIFFSGGLYCGVFDIVHLHWSIVPIGGLMMILGWLALACAGIFAGFVPSDD